MAILNAWQRPDRVLKGMPWGDGKDGSPTVSSCPNVYATYIATAASTAGTAGSTAFANGDLVVCIQMQGTGAGQWEVNQIASGGGTTSLVMKEANHYTYGTGAQIIKVPRYITPTISSHSSTAWNGTTGGLETFCVKNNILGTATITLTGLGFRGGTGGDSGLNNGQIDAYSGESYAGSQTKTKSANYAGGGGGNNHNVGNSDAQGGGGGGHTTNGQVGSDREAPYTESGGSGGGSAGVTDLTSIFPGSGGGGGGARPANGGNNGGNGGNGGAILIIFAKNIPNTISIENNGGNGGAGTNIAGGGGGSAGSILFVCNTATVGTVTASGGSGGASNAAGGAGGLGSVGRIAIHHSGTVTGTTSPTFTDVSDATLMESGGGGILLNFL